MCIPLCASILFVLRAGNHTNVISACVSYTRIRNHSPKCVPPAGHHRVVLSISAPVNKTYCAFHPSAITIAISACAFQSVHSSLRIPPTGNPPLQSVCVQHESETAASTLAESHQCNQCLCVLHAHQKPQSKVCSTLCFLFFLHQLTKTIVNSTPESQEPSPSQSVLVHSILRVSSTVNRSIAVNACVSCIRISNHSPWCVPLAGHHQRNQCLIHLLVIVLRLTSQALQLTRASCPWPSS